MGFFYRLLQATALLVVGPFYIACLAACIVVNSVPPEVHTMRLVHWYRGSHKAMKAWWCSECQQSVGP